jgi:quaternary ammonium compound-resistance protein SugE
MAWGYLFLAALCEVGWILLLKINNGFVRLIPSIAAVVLILLGPIFFSQAIKTLSVGTSYAVWVGINSIILILLRMYYFDEPITFQKTICVVLIVLGAVGLKLIDSGVIKT